VEQWLPEISKPEAVDRDRPNSPKIFANVWLVERRCEGIAPHFCGLFGVEGNYSATGEQRKIQNVGNEEKLMRKTGQL
jgi:hypothetical protein